MNLTFIVNKTGKLKLLLIILTNIMGGLSGILLAEIVNYIVSFSPDKSISDIINFTIISTTLFLATYAIVLFNNLLINRAKKDIIFKIKKAFLKDELGHGDIAKFTSSKISFITNEIKLVKDNYLTPLFEMLSQLPIVISAMVYLIKIDFILGTLFILFSILSFLPVYIRGDSLTKSEMEWSKQNGEFINKCKDSLNGLHIAQTYLAEEGLQSNIHNSLEKAETSLRIMKFNESLLTTFITYVSMIVKFLPLTVSLFFILEGRLDAAIVSAMLQASNFVSNPMQVILSLYAQTKLSKDIIENRMNFINQSNEPPTKQSLPELENPNLFINNMTYITANESELFNELNLTVAYGEKVLITGQSGSGKSTLFSLLLGFEVPTSGNITYRDAHSEIDAIEVYKTNMFARIGQEPFMFSETLEFNLTLGKRFDPIDIYDVLEKMRLIEELGEECLKKNYGVNGAQLSGGQKQRVEIARALLHNKKIILVDEATSQLNKERAAMIHKILWNLPQTVIEIAHHYDEQELVNNNIKHYHLEKGIFI